MLLGNEQGRIRITVLHKSILKGWIIIAILTHASNVIFFKLFTHNCPVKLSLRKDSGL